MYGSRPAIILLALGAMLSGSRATAAGHASAAAIDPVVAATQLGSLRVLTLNTWLLSTPILIPGDAPCLSGRGRLLGRRLAQGSGHTDYDVVLLQEVFNNGAKDRILEEAGSKYPYSVFKQPGASFLDINGGTAVLSKFPFLPVWYGLYGQPLSYYAQAWDECDGDDCHAQKGWLHVRIDFHGIPVNFISLHAQANYADGGDNYTWTQEQQIEQLKTYLDSFPNPLFAADLSSELVIIGGDFNALAHCAGCKMSSDYMSVAGILGKREAWRESHCYLDGSGEYAWSTGYYGENGSTKPDGLQRLDMLLYSDSGASVDLRASNVETDNFYIGSNPPVSCEDDGDFSKPYPSLYVSDHFGVASTFTIYQPGAAPSENTACGPIPPEPATGNPFRYTRDRDEFLACYGIAGGISSNCRDIGDFNDQQLCYAMSNGSPATCPSMTIRDLQLACYGMSIRVGSNCNDIKNLNTRNFCYGVSNRNIAYCRSITDRNTQLLCYALSNGISSNCRDISDLNDRQFCYGASSRNNSYCSSIQ